MAYMALYDPCRPNDRLLLGMKGSISEFELGIIRSLPNREKYRETAAYSLENIGRRYELRSIDGHKKHF